ncbi:MAG: ATP-binding protein [Phycisphaerales bacterium]
MATKKRSHVDEPGGAGAAGAGREVLSLDEIIGQEAAVRTLRSALSGGRLHHAWIFSGPQGVGKFTTAVAFAAMLLDTDLSADLAGRLASDPDGATQRLMRAGTHPDFHVVTKELARVSRNDRVRDQKQISIPKEVVEEFLTEPASRTRVRIGESIAGKVFIIDEAELLNAASQNVLLKTLEEPPAGTVIVLVTSIEDRLLPTIRSRCQRVQFSPLSDGRMRGWMKREGMSVGADEEQWLVRFGAGAPGMVRLALEHELLKWDESLRPLLSGAEEGRYAVQFGPTMHHLVDGQAAAWVKRYPEASKDAANKAWARRLLGYLGEHYRGRLSASASGTGGPGVGRCVSSIDAIAQAEEELGTNVNMQFVFENLAVRLCAERRS